MERISYFTVVIILLSLIVIREGIKSQFSGLFGCEYGKNILLDSNFYTSSMMVCSEMNYFGLSVFLALFLITLSLLFFILEDYRTFRTIFMASFSFLLIDIISFHYTNVNYLSMFFFFCCTLFNITIFNYVVKEE